MKENKSKRNIVITLFFGIIIIYILFHVAGGKLFNKSSGEQALEARENLQQEVEAERLRQEEEALTNIQNEIDLTDLGTLPQ